MISDDNMEQALDWIRDNANKFAQAKADRIYMENYLKTIEAGLCAEKAGDSVKTQENHARTHATYVRQLQAIREAVQQEEAMRWLMVAAQAKIEVWRSQQANLRAEGKAFL